MDTVILAIYVIIAVGLIGLILIQHGKGADAGANFGGGSGASESVFGSQGSGNFLTKTTAVLATLFFAMALFLSYLSGQTITQKQDDLKVETSAPAQPQSADIPAIPGTTAPADMDTIDTTGTSEDKPSIPQ